MKFEMWTWYHYLYILSPFITIAILYLLLKNKSEKAKYIVGMIIGILSLIVIVARNVDILIRNGFDPEIIPLQVCHFGNIAVFISLVFKNKTAAAIAFCVNLIPALSSLIIADSLAGYNTIWRIRPQAYIWGHYFIVLGAMYAVVLKVVKFSFKDFLRGLLITAVLLVISIVLNTVFNDLLNYTANYFYVYNSSGIPFEMFYNLAPSITIGRWFTFNPVYLLCLIALGLIVIWSMYLLAALIFKPKKYITKIRYN